MPDQPAAAAAASSESKPDAAGDDSDVRIVERKDSSMSTEGESDQENDVPILMSQFSPLIVHSPTDLVSPPGFPNAQPTKEKTREQSVSNVSISSPRARTPMSCISQNSEHEYAVPSDRSCRDEADIQFSPPPPSALDPPQIQMSEFIVQLGRNVGLTPNNKRLKLRTSTPVLGMSRQGSVKQQPFYSLPTSTTTDQLVERISEAMIDCPFAHKVDTPPPSTFSSQRLASFQLNESALTPTALPRPQATPYWLPKAKGNDFAKVTESQLIQDENMFRDCVRAGSYADAMLMFVRQIIESLPDFDDKDLVLFALNLLDTAIVESLHRSLAALQRTVIRRRDIAITRHLSEPDVALLRSAPFLAADSLYDMDVVEKISASKMDKNRDEAFRRLASPKQNKPAATVTSPNQSGQSFRSFKSPPGQPRSQQPARPAGQQSQHSNNEQSQQQHKRKFNNQNKGNKSKQNSSNKMPKK